MKPFRAIIALLVGLAIAISPVGAAWASVKTVVSAQSLATEVGAAATAEMTDCEKMMRAAGHLGQLNTGKVDCPCCDMQGACPPDLCVFKCFKVFGVIVPTNIIGTLATLLFQRDQPERPPDWIDSPQPPPPRA